MARKGGHMRPEDEDFREKPPPTPPTVVDPHDDYRDRAVQASNFRFWMTTRDDPRYRDLKEAMDKAKAWGVRFDREKILEKLDWDEHLVELLTAAEMEWRVDKRGQEKLRSKMDIDADARFDYRNPVMAHSMTCNFSLSTGNRCGGEVIHGTTRCRHHGGELVDATTRRAVLMSSYLQLVEATSVAVQALVDVATTSRNDLARVNAAREILDRAGLTAELQVSVTIEGEGRDQKIAALKSKLDSMQSGLQTRAVDAASREVVELEAGD